MRLSSRCLGNLIRLLKHGFSNPAKEVLAREGCSRTTCPDAECPNLFGVENKPSRGSLSLEENKPQRSPGIPYETIGKASWGCSALPVSPFHFQLSVASRTFPSACGMGVQYRKAFAVEDSV